jgi:hypothetical protein
MEERKKLSGDVAWISFRWLAESGANVDAFQPRSQPRERFAE